MLAEIETVKGQAPPKYCPNFKQFYSVAPFALCLRATYKHSHKVYTGIFERETESSNLKFSKIVTQTQPSKHSTGYQQACRGDSGSSWWSMEKNQDGEDMAVALAVSSVAGGSAASGMSYAVAMSLADPDVNKWIKKRANLK